MPRNKYVGKRAKIEAIRRFCGVELPQTSLTNEVEEYIAKNLYNTTRWKAYLDIFYEVRNEKMDVEATNLDNLFVDGIWFAVQHIVIIRDMPVIAAGIVSEACLSIADCKAAQKRSGSHKEQMDRFIKVELANLF